MIFEYIYTCYVVTQSRMHLRLLFKFPLLLCKCMAYLRRFSKDKDHICFEDSRKKTLLARPTENLKAAFEVCSYL